MLSAHFWERVERPGNEDCWTYTGGKDPDGYGIYRPPLSKIKFRAHRFAFQAATGHDPDKLFVCHTCDNPSCCNPRHLFLATAAGNHDDMVRKNRRGRPSAKLTEQQVKTIRNRYSTGKIRQQDLADEYGVSQVLISAIIRGATWKSVA